MRLGLRKNFSINVKSAFVFSADYIYRHPVPSAWNEMWTLLRRRVDQSSVRGSFNSKKGGINGEI